MPLTARLFAVTIDAADPFELARFYQAIAGSEVTRGSDASFCLVERGRPRCRPTRGR
jgi:hypothetical protein